MHNQAPIQRRKSKRIYVGNVPVGDGAPIAVQSMTNTPTEDVAATVAQIHRLEEVGCEIIRCTVPTLEAAKAISEIRKQISIPLVADIHFDYKMAIAAMENGADKIRINPGNIGGADRVAEVVRVARERNIPIRVGVNSGSLEKDLVEKYHGVTAEGIVESALDKVHMIEDLGYDNLVISIIKDITDETRREQELDKERRRTAELADRVIEKQMRVAQEIASLLGETTAETKIALTRLKDTIEPGGEVKR